MSEWSLTQPLSGLHDDIQQRLEIVRKNFGHPGAKSSAALPTTSIVAACDEPGCAGERMCTSDTCSTSPATIYHRYFECNYGTTLVPFDRWFSTFHDGSAETHARMTERWGEKRNPHIADAER